MSFKPGVDGHKDAREESERETENSRVDHSLVVEVDFESTKESRTLEPAITSSASYCRCFILSMETLYRDVNIFIYRSFFTLGLPLKVPSTKKLIWARLGVSRTIYVNVDSPDLGFPYFNFLGEAQCKINTLYL